MSSPDFTNLVRFLVEPFLESPDSLSIDSEVSSSKSKTLIRLAFEGDDRGRVFGRGGRNIQAIRKVVEAAAALVSWSVRLEVYGEPSHDHSPSGEGSRSGENRSSSSRKPRRQPPRHRERSQ